MIIDDIVNELDKFITKYKETKTNADKGQSLRSNVKQALSEKGVQGTDSLDDTAIVESIKSLSTGSTWSNSNYQSLIDSISTQNIFRKKNASELEPIGNIEEAFEVVEENSVKIYSLYAIENVKIGEGAYKNRVTQTSSSDSHQLSLETIRSCGNVTFNSLTLSVTPQEAENINGEVVIKYTTNGQEHSVTMPIKDLKKTLTQ